MLFGLLIVLPITIVAWIFLRIFWRKSKLNFEDLHLSVGLVIIGLLLAAFFGAMAIAIVVQIGRHPWVLLILVPLSIIVALLDRFQTKARQKSQG
jgi:hypothetical protein